MLVTTQWPLKPAADLNSLVWVCVLWRPESLTELSALCTEIILKIIFLRLYWNLSGANELNWSVPKHNKTQHASHGHNSWNVLCITHFYFTGKRILQKTLYLLPTHDILQLHDKHQYRHKPCVINVETMTWQITLKYTAAKLGSICGQRVQHAVAGNGHHLCLF